MLRSFRCNGRPRQGSGERGPLQDSAGVTSIVGIGNTCRSSRFASVSSGPDRTFSPKEMLRA